MTFYKPQNLPRLMVAPNGSRRMKSDHPMIPITIPEIVKTAKACYLNGAEAIHFHVRDNAGVHVLDAGLYKEALKELGKEVPKMHLQITTEAVGRYSPVEMRQLAYDATPPGISIGIREMIPSFKPTKDDIRFYQYLTEKGIRIQHICYFPEEIDLLSNLLDQAELPKYDVWCMFTIGHYTGRVSDPNSIPLFLEKLKSNNMTSDWAICAFAKEEISCLKMAIKLEGKIRVGFENSLLMPDGKIAPNNETKVKSANKLFI